MSWYHNCNMFSIVYLNGGVWAPPSKCTQISKTINKLMNILLTILTIFLSICFYNPSLKDNSNLITFDLKDLPKESTVNLSDLGFEDIDYIPLETNDKSLISRITGVRFGYDFFIIQYYNTILMFKNDGSFVTKIGTEGRGPNEFTVVHDIDIDKTNQNIYLVSAWQRKFFVYSENGEFLRTFQSPPNTTNFRITENGILCYSINSFANTEISFNLIDPYGKVLKSYSNKYLWQQTHSYSYVFQYENLFYSFNNKLFKKEVYSDTIYSYENMSFEPHLIIEQGKRLITPKARTNSSPDQISDNYIVPINLFEFGDNIYYEFLVGRIGLSFIGSMNKDIHVLVDPANGIINDIDGGPAIWPKTVKGDKIMISWIDAIELKKYVASEDFKNSRPKYPKKKEELEKLANNLEETDNPILILVKL